MFACNHFVPAELGNEKAGVYSFLLEAWWGKPDIDSLLVEESTGFRSHKVSRRDEDHSENRHVGCGEAECTALYNHCIMGGKVRKTHRFVRIHFDMVWTGCTVLGSSVAWEH